MSKLRETLEAGAFPVVVELKPPKGTGVDEMLAVVKALAGRVTAFSLPDNEHARMRLAAVAAGRLVQEAGGEALVHLTPHVGADGFFVFALTPDKGPATTESRMFCPVIGVPEDPVSGNAHGMLGVYLVSNGLLAADDGVARFVGHQGRFVGRPGIVEVEVAASGKRANSVRVTGDAVIVFQAELPL